MKLRSIPEIIYQWIDNDMRQSDTDMARIVADIIENASIYKTSP